MEKRNLINGYYLLEHDLKEILSFIEPTQDNFSAYSQRLYALYMRACMEFEASCKMILIEQGYQLPEKPYINIYFDIHEYEQYKFINDYIVKLQVSEEIILTPLKGWKKEGSIDWYKAHHEVKHSRVQGFSKANLINVLNAVAAVYILLYARYGTAALNQHQETRDWVEDEGFIYKESSLFRIKPLTIK